LGVCTASAEQHKEIDAQPKWSARCRQHRSKKAVNGAHDSDEFLANNSGLVASSPAVTTRPVLPRHALLLLHEPSRVRAGCPCSQPLAVAWAPADSCNVTGVQLQSLPTEPHTQLDLMRQHMNIYHGLSGQEEVQLTTLACRPVDFGAPGGSHRLQRKPEKVTCAGANPVTSLCCQRENFEAFGLVGCKARRQALHPASRLACSASDILDLRLKPPADAADAEDAEQRDCSIPASLVIDQLAIVGFLQVSLRHPGSQPEAAGRCGVADVPEAAAAAAGQAPKAAAAEDDREATEQNFTDVQNSQLQGWFSEHRQKPYPSTADTHRLAELTGLSYPQVKKWFANRRMRTKTPCELLPGDAQCGEIRSSGLSSGKASPSNWSLAEFRSENSPA
uniref:Homeobox domain-containing protein n=1 Tax=Macrostomum lignano TaxID=282301 RepID=A0A1I8FK29_9PLAT